MSPRRQPDSLYKHCVCHMSNVLNSLADSYKNIIDHRDILTVLHFVLNYLPSEVHRDIGRAIVSYNDCLQKAFYPSHIKVLLRLKTKSLSLSGSVVLSEVLSGEDASHLEHLSLAYGDYGDKAAKLHSFLVTARNLTHLECRNFCNNTMMGIIGSSCLNLYCLELRGCDVTDEGILKLCGFEQSLRDCINILSAGSKLSPTSRCARTLKEIKFSMTKITEAGVAIILLVLTNIYLLRVPDIPMEKLFTFLRTIDHKDIQCNLKEFHSREILDEIQLAVLTGLCPNLEYFQMSFVGKFDMDRIRLQKLTRLKMLAGAKFADVNTDALMVFLSEMGNQLRTLFLYTYRTNFSQEKLKISHSHLWNLAKYCPNLKTLTIESYSLYEESLPIRYLNNNYQFFQSLHTLNLLYMKLSNEDLRVFLNKCTNMKNLQLILNDPYVLHDKFVHELLDEGVWTNLTDVKILNSPITMGVILRLINECPKLQNLGCLKTLLVANDQILELKEKVKKQNLDIEIS